jgi:hypothetical protein
MGTTRAVVNVKKSDSPEWLRCQHAIRKLILHTGKDALVYAQGALDHEDTEPERLKVFWDNARKFFDDYEMPKAPKPAPKTVRIAPKAVEPEAPPPAPGAPEIQVPMAVPAPEKEA